MGVVGYDHAVVGQEFWYALPIPTNKSQKDVRIIKAEMIDPPSGVKVLGYGAYRLADTGGLPLMAVDGAPGTPEYRKLKDHSKSGFKVKARALSEVFYVAHLKVTGPIRKNPTNCSFEYTQSDQRYVQTLGCEFELRLKK
ncbi:hypothetical protein SAMN05444521_2812 [Streptomyces sp. 3214.6]|nr:hypothetical protein SAMN05444521_2812 [Streptomyces sp. 3214.6]